MRLSLSLKSSPKRPKDTEGKGDSTVDSKKSDTELKLNDKAGHKPTELSSAPGESKPPTEGQLTSEKVREASLLTVELDMKQPFFTMFYIDLLFRGDLLIWSYIRAWSRVSFPKAF